MHVYLWHNVVTISIKFDFYDLCVKYFCQRTLQTPKPNFIKILPTVSQIKNTHKWKKARLFHCVFLCTSQETHEDIKIFNVISVLGRYAQRLQVQPSTALYSFHTVKVLIVMFKEFSHECVVLCILCTECIKLKYNGRSCQYVLIFYLWNYRTNRDRIGTRRYEHQNSSKKFKFCSNPSGMTCVLHESQIKMNQFYKKMFVRFITLSRQFLSLLHVQQVPGY
jgi:hypothetical protein